MAPVFLTVVLRSDHQGKGSGPDKYNHRNAHKEIFHVCRSAHLLIRLKKQSPTEYRELKSDAIGNKNYPAMPSTPAQNSVPSRCQTALIYA